MKTNRFEIYSNIIDNAKDIILIMTADGRIVEANREAVKTYGYTYDELTQMGIFQLRDPRRLELAQKQFSLAKAEGIEFEAMHYKKDGSAFPVEVKSIGVQDHESNEYVVSIIRDITNRRKREEEIIRLASIVESSHDAILGTTADGIINSWNQGAERLYGYQKPEILGKPLSILIPAESNDKMYSIIGRAKNQKGMNHYTTIRQTKDGRKVEVYISISPIHDMEGTFAGVSAIVRDLTEQNILNKKIKEYEDRWQLANELVTANAFQTSLMSAIKSNDAAVIYGKFIPCSAVGGDMYDCVMAGESLWFIIADAVGHGLVSAMVSIMVKGAFNNLIETCRYPNELLEKLNAMLMEVTGGYEKQLVSAFAGVVRNGTLYYSNAGHPYPILIDSSNENVSVLEQNGFLLSMQEDAKYEVGQTGIHPGDMILLYTDGLFNPKVNDHTTFWDTMGGITAQKMDLAKADPRSFLEELTSAIQNLNGSDFEDDVGIMLIKMRK